MFDKINKWFDKNKLFIKGVISVIAGLSFIAKPEIVPDWLIILIGVSWLFEGITDLAEDLMDKRD